MLQQTDDCTKDLSDVDTNAATINVNGLVNVIAIAVRRLALQVLWLK
jgi:hypothetical protein